MNYKTYSYYTKKDFQQLDEAIEECASKILLINEVEQIISFQTYGLSYRNTTGNKYRIIFLVQLK